MHSFAPKDSRLTEERLIDSVNGKLRADAPFAQNHERTHSSPGTAGEAEIPISSDTVNSVSMQGVGRDLACVVL